MRSRSIAAKVCLVTLISASLSASAADLPCKVTMGWEPWPPIQFLDDNKQLTGIDVELMFAVFKAMPCELVYKKGNWTRSLFEVKNGSLDALSGADYTAARSKWARYSVPYRDDSMVMYTLKGNSKKFPFKSLADIVGTDFRLGIVRGVNYGTAFAEYANRPDFAKHLYYLESPVLQRYEILKAKRIDAFTYPPSALNMLKEKTGDNVEIHPFVIHSAKQHVIFSQRSVNQETVDKFNTALDAVITNGDYDQILSKYKKK